MGNEGAKVPKDTNMENASKPSSKPLPCENITNVEKVANLKHEVWKLTKLHVKHLEEKMKKLQDHLISLNFSMDDQKLQLAKVKSSIHVVEATLQVFLKYKTPFEHEVYISWKV
jgi:hypothetical protein